MVEEYSELLDYYKGLFDQIDVFHFNSYNTAEVYKRYLRIPGSSKVIPITHSGIDDRRKQRSFDEKLLRLGFIGSEAPYKGLPILKEVLSRLDRNGLSDRIELNVYGGKTGVDDQLKNVYYKGRFTSSQMEDVFNSIELLVVPSICNETFSLITLEALQYGVPVMVSKNVGARMLIEKISDQFVFDGIEDLYKIINGLLSDKRPLTLFNEKLLSVEWNYSMADHAQTIISELYK
ncbi:MAG: glycosyltransferase [Bacteroidaceae bacterium]|nr:glycosyltransferase [Bacteroidaceae bacterium]